MSEGHTSAQPRVQGKVIRSTVIHEHHYPPSKMCLPSKPEIVGNVGDKTIKPKPKFLSNLGFHIVDIQIPVSGYFHYI